MPEHRLNDKIDVGVMFSFRNPAAWRRAFQDVYADELQLVQEAERLGFDTIWLTEHHFADDGYSPSIITIAAAIAAATERVRIGFNLLLLPLHNAIRVAEDIATLDVIANGRIDPGFGQGYAPHEFAGYGIDRSERLSRFLEGLKVLQGLWSQDTFSYEGRHYQIDSARLVPKPVQTPMPLWLGATSEAGVRRAGRMGANLLGLASGKLQTIYDEARQTGGYDPDTAKVLQLHWTHTAASEDAAWDEAGPHFHHLLSVYGQWAADAGGHQAIPMPPPPPVEQLRDPAQRMMFRPGFGTAATVAATLNRAVGRMRCTHIATGVLPGMAPERTRASLERFAAEVAPRLG